MCFDAIREISDIELIKNIVGKDKFDELLFNFGGTSVYFPSQIVDTSEIFDDFENNLSLSTIRKKYKKSMTWVRNQQKLYLAEKKNGQKKLFNNLN